jgi:hypothetical protein
MWRDGAATADRDLPGFSGLTSVRSEIKWVVAAGRHLPKLTDPVL